MMIHFRKKNSGMKLTKSRLIGGGIGCFLLGFFARQIIVDIPFFTFDTKIDISSIVSVLGLFATIFFIPLIINKLIDKEKNTNALLIKDLDEISNLVDGLVAFYQRKIKESSKNINKDDFTFIVYSFKQIASLLDTVKDEFNERKMMENFEKEVIKRYYGKANKQCTDEISVNKRIDDAYIRKSMICLFNFKKKIKHTRYSIFD